MDHPSEPKPIARGPNALALWAREHELGHAAEMAKRTRALELTVQCINDGTLTELDSAESPLSHQIKAHHNRHAVEMNSHWIGTAQEWTCPCCGRSKFQISRVGNKGQILAKLVEHHDHMADALKDAFNKVFIDTQTRQETSTGLALVERMATAFASYDPVLVCEDCNIADANAKSWLKDYDKINVKHQSFSISQIRQFINVQPHTPHDIDFDTLKTLWLAVRPAYIARMKLIFEVAKAAVTQDHWYEKYPLGFIAVPTLSNRTSVHARQPGLAWVSPDALHRAVQKNTISHRSNWSRWRTEPKKPGEEPPENYLAIVLSKAGCARMWNATADDWHCPICERAKHQTVSNKQGDVSFQTHQPTSRSKLWRLVPLICGECSNVVKSMKLELSKGFGVPVAATFDCITPQQLRSIMTARPYSPPLIDSVKAKALVENYVRHAE